MWFVHPGWGFRRVREITKVPGGFQTTDRTDKSIGYTCLTSCRTHTRYGKVYEYFACSRTLTRNPRILRNVDNFLTGI